MRGRNGDATGETDEWGLITIETRDPRKRKAQPETEEASLWGLGNPEQAEPGSLL
jgi:hypothetical protein